MAAWCGRRAELPLQGIGPGAIQWIMTPQAPGTIGIIQPLTEPEPSLQGPGRILASLEMQQHLIIEEIAGQAPGPGGGGLLQGDVQPAVALSQAGLGPDQHAATQAAGPGFAGLAGRQQQGCGLALAAEGLEIIDEKIQGEPHVGACAGGGSGTNGNGEALEIHPLQRLEP